MTTYFSINPDFVHLWCVNLADFFSEEREFIQILSIDEQLRAERFPPPVRLRFILARSFLRKILSLYTLQEPSHIAFLYTDKGKPFLKNNSLGIQFNVSHSANLALYGFTMNKPIGVDIQKKNPKIPLKIAERFFNTEELRLLKNKTNKAQSELFYQLWTQKEARVKASGIGIFGRESNEDRWIVESCDFHQDYASAFASLPPIHKIIRWGWNIHGHYLL